jgi:tetratricopeptide (TPR) repeat protein
MNRVVIFSYGCRRKVLRSVLCILILCGLCGFISLCRAQQRSSTVNRSEERSPEAEAELQTGIRLTHEGHFAEAIPHLLAAQGRVPEAYAASFDLALCYVATGHSDDAIRILTKWTGGEHDTDVYNLLAQAYVGNAQSREALDSLEKAAAVTPQNEKLYLLIADACMGSQNYALGLQVVDLGLRHLPDSARLHYQRGMFLSLLDQFDSGKNDLELARRLAPGNTIAFVAAAQESMFEGDVPEAIRVAREGIKTGHQDFLLQTLLGEALLRSGIAPGQPEFDEARNALETSVGERPNYAGSQLALGKLYLLEDRTSDAIAHLEAARQLNAGNPAVYSNLATAYRKQGNVQQAQSALAILAKLNHEQAEKIRLAPGDRKVGYGEAAAAAPK